MLTIRSSHRLEDIRTALCAGILTASQDLPLSAKVRVVVPDTGLEQWLKLEIATGLGC